MINSLNKIINLFSSKLIKTVIQLILVGGLFLLVYTIYIKMSTLSEIKQTLKANQNLQSKIDSIQSENKIIFEQISKLEQREAVFNDMINKNNYLIEQNNKKLNDLKKGYNDKINNASSYSVRQLDSFFTKRYKGDK